MLLRFPTALLGLTVSLAAQAQTQQVPLDTTGCTEGQALVYRTNPPRIACAPLGPGLLSDSSSLRLDFSLIPGLNERNRQNGAHEFYNQVQVTGTNARFDATGAAQSKPCRLSAGPPSGGAQLGECVVDSVSGMAYFGNSAGSFVPAGGGSGPAGGGPTRSVALPLTTAPPQIAASDRPGRVVEFSTAPSAPAQAAAAAVSNALVLPVASCQGGKPSTSLGLPADGPARAICVAEGSTPMGALSFRDGSTSAVETALTLSALPSPSTVELRWYAQATSGNVVWGVQFACMSDDVGAKPGWTPPYGVQAFPSPSEGRIVNSRVTPPTIPVCSNGSPLLIRVFRDGASPRDTLTKDAQLVVIRVAPGVAR